MKININTPFEFKNGMRLKNRLILAPLYYDWDFGSRAFTKFYEKRAKGGVSMMVVPVPTHGGILDLCAPEFNSNSLLFIDRIKQYGCCVIPQIFSGPGECVNSYGTANFRAIVEELKVAAKNLEKLGYAGLEIHGAHHSLFMSLLSAGVNEREDEYGGDLIGRMKLSLDAVKAIRAIVQPDFLMFFRFSVSEFTEKGIDIISACEFARQLEIAGVDCIDVSAGGTLISPKYSDAPDSSYGEGCFANLSSEIKKSVMVPVIVAGRINTLEVAESILRENKADLLALGRVLVKHSNWLEMTQISSASMEAT